MNIVIANRQRVKKIDLQMFKKIVAVILTELKIAEAEIGINFVGAKRMAEINRRFLQHEGSTDVIAFNYAKKRKVKRTEQKHLSGEIFICVEEAILQAEKFSASWRSEITRYIVHGVLHLLGHDDLRADLRRKMKREENRLLRKLSRRFALSKL